MHDTNALTGLTVLAGVATVDTSEKQQITSVLSETFTKAQGKSLVMAKVMGVANEPYLIHTYYGDQYPFIPSSYVQRYGKPQLKAYVNFLNE